VEIELRRSPYLLRDEQQQDAGDETNEPIHTTSTLARGSTR
jgi:hypothetical protein